MTLATITPLVNLLSCSNGDTLQQTRFASWHGTHPQDNAREKSASQPIAVGPHQLGKVGQLLFKEQSAKHTHKVNRLPCTNVQGTSAFVQHEHGRNREPHTKQYPSMHIIVHESCSAATNIGRLHRSIPPKLHLAQGTSTPTLTTARRGANSVIPARGGLSAQVYNHFTAHQHSKDMSHA